MPLWMLTGGMFSITACAPWRCVFHFGKLVILGYRVLMHTHVAGAVTSLAQESDLSFGLGLLSNRSQASSVSNLSPAKRHFCERYRCSHTKHASVLGGCPDHEISYVPVGRFSYYAQDFPLVTEGAHFEPSKQLVLGFICLRGPPFQQY